MKRFFKSMLIIMSAIMLLQIPISAYAHDECGRNYTADVYEGNKDTASKTIADIVENNENFSTLNTALKAADLIDTLKGDGFFTVFAPVNEAFSKLPKGTLEGLLKPENKEQLKNILLYHVSNGSFSSSKLSRLEGKEIPLSNGKTAKISSKDGSIFINNSKVTAADIKAKNGIIHIIDAVLIPQ